MTGTPAPPVIREAPRELLSLACAIRPDWTREETWDAMHAAKTAGLGWARLALRLTAIALREEDPPTRPRELWDFARGITAKAAAAGGPEVYAHGGALWRAAYAEVQARVTGGQPALTGDTDRNEH